MHPPADHHPLVHLVRSADADLSASGVGRHPGISDLAPFESFTFPLDGGPARVCWGRAPRTGGAGVSCVVGPRSAPTVCVLDAGGASDPTLCA